MIAGNGEQVGFFGEVTGTITGINLRYVTVISTGADAVVGAIAAKANEIATSTAQGHVYTSDDSTVGFLAGETTGEVTASAAVGYVKVKGGEVTVGGIVGKTNANVTANAFVEINKIGASTVTAGGIAGSTVGEVTLSGSYLKGSAGTADTVVNNGSAVAYATYMANNQTIRGMVIGYVMKNFYVGTIDVTEEGFEQYTINNYRQLAIAEMYSWATYTLGADIELPYSYGNGVHAGEYAYIDNAIDQNGKKIIASLSGTFMGVVEEVR